MENIPHEAPGKQVAFASIPEELRARPQWIVWRLEERNGQPTKVPYIAGGVGKALPNDLTTWRTFDDAIAAYETGRYSGIGFVFSNADPYCGIDLDKCVDPDTGEIAPWAREIIDAFDSYTEVSQSGTGVHIIVRGKAPNRKRGGIEAYSEGRYFALTGRVI